MPHSRLKINFCPAQVVQQQKIESTQQTSVGDGVQSKVLRDKLLQLEQEIERFRNENSTLTKLRKEREEVIYCGVPGLPCLS